MSRNGGQKQGRLLHGGVAAADSSGRANSNGFIPSSFRTLSGYMKTVSSGASIVARSAAASFASSILDKDGDADPNQVIWAGFDSIEGQGKVIRKVLLLGYSSGFHVWDVDDSNNVCDLASRHDGPVSFMQMVPSPIVSKRPEDKFANSRPLLVVCTDSFLADGGKIQDGLVATCNGGALNCHDQVKGNCLPTTVQFYSMRSQLYAHVLKFRSVVYSIRCSSRIVAVSQATQIHCFSATTLEREYTLLTNPIVMGGIGSGGIGFGPLAVGPRWLAYSGSPAATAPSGRVSPQHLTPSASFPCFSSNGSLVAHYAKESSKHLAAGIVTLGDMGYKKLSRYCSELRPDSTGSIQSANSSPKGNGMISHSTDVDNIGMVIVRDIVSKNVIAQFRAHKSPISALCFDPSGIILVTASVQGHNINVFKIMPGYERVSTSDAGPSYVHLYRLQRGFTNAVIQDISFSVDSKWIMISSSRGTSHLFAINPQGGPVNILSYDNSLTENNGGLGVMSNQAVRWPHSSSLEICKPQSLCAVGPPITLSVVSRIRNGSNGWRSTVTGAAAAATSRMSSISGAIASSFCNFEGSSSFYVNGNYSKEKYHLLVFSPTGSMIQYALQTISSQDSVVVSGLTPAYESVPLTDARVLVEPIQKWSISRRHSWREGEDNIDIYGETEVSDSNKVYLEEVKKDSIIGPKINDIYQKLNSYSEKECRLYISEAELQMHEAKIPLWSKTEIYFHSMGKEATLMADEQVSSRGEFEIEKIPTRVIEVRSKDLVPIFDYMQTPKFQPLRAPAVDNRNEQLLHQSYKLFEKGRVSPRSFLESPDCIMTNSRGTIAETGIQGNEWNDHLIPVETKGFVNKDNTLKPNTRPKIVNNRIEYFNMDDRHMFVNGDSRGLNLENHCEEKRDEFD